MGTYTSDVITTEHVTMTSLLNTSLPVNSTEDDDDYYYDYDFTDGQTRLLDSSEKMWLWVAPCIILFGTAGNMLSIVILLSKHFRHSPSSLMLCMLALVDTGNIVTGLLRQWLKYRFEMDIRQQSTASCKVHYYCTYLFGSLCAWTLVLVTTERAISVITPLRARQICSRRRMFVAMVIVYALLACSYIYLLVWASLVEDSYYDEKWIVEKVCMFRKDKYDYLYWQDIMQSSVVPSCLIFLGNSLIIYQLCAASRRRKQSMNVSTKNDQIGATTAMLLAVSFVFLITTLPYSVYLLDVDNWWDMDSLGGLVNQEFAYCIFTLLYYLNNAVNFWLYCISGNKFRKALKAMFTCAKPMKSPREIKRKMTVSSIYQSDDNLHTTPVSEQPGGSAVTSNGTSAVDTSSTV